MCFLPFLKYVVGRQMPDVLKSAVLVEFFAVLPQNSTSTADFMGMGLAMRRSQSQFGKAHTVPS